MKINIIKIFELIFITALFSCSTKEAKIPELSFNYSIDTLHFDGGLNLDNRGGSVKSIDITTINDSVFIYIKSGISDTLYKFYYGDKIKVVDKFCLPEEYSISESIYASISGKTKYGKLNSLKVINNDSIIFMHENLISIYNLKSKSIDFKFLCNDLDTTNWRFSNNFNPVRYNSSENKIYTELIRYDIPENPDGSIDSVFIAAIDIKTGKITSIPFKLPTNGRMGNMHLSEHFIIMNERVLCSFSTSALVYDYDIKSQKVTNHEIKSSKQDKSINNISKPEDGYDKLLESYISTFVYSSFAYDISNERLIRTFFYPQEKREKDSLMQGLRRSFGCIIYNNDLKALGEILMNVNESPDMWFATKGKIYAVLLTANMEHLKILKIKYEI